MQMGRERGQSDNTFLSQFCQSGDCDSNTTLTKPCGKKVLSDCPTPIHIYFSGLHLFVPFYIGNVDYLAGTVAFVVSGDARG